MNRHGASLLLDDIDITFPQGSRVLNHISTRIQPGEIVALCGVSGAGKSTLLRIIAGLQQASSGTVAIDGKAVTRPPEGLGYLVQNYAQSLFPWLTVYGNLRLALTGTKIPRAEWSERINQVLRAVDLDKLGHRYPWQLSGGMQQRVALARALVREPRLLLLDEPFASVDSFARMELEDLTRRLISTHGITTILVTHDLREAIYMANRVLVLGGKPATLTDEIMVTLPLERTQGNILDIPEFTQLQRRLFDSIQRARASDGVAPSDTVEP